MTHGHRIHKRRYSIRTADGMPWEIDAFLDRALVLAEIELSTADALVELPDWLRGVIVREVTTEPAYTNAALAK